MKKFTFLFALLFVFLTSGFSQGCLPEGIHFSSQDQIDNFQTNYPGCTIIEGDVTIYGENIKDLSGLNVLETIGGELFISECDSLISLNGLNNITTIGGTVFISFNRRFKDLTGLENLTSINGEIWIQNHDSLQSLNGLERLIAINGRLLIGGNTMLTNLEGISNIDPNSITKLLISSNNSLSDCSSQSICDFVNNPSGSIDIFDNSPGCNYPYEIASKCGFVMPCLPYGNYNLFDQNQIDSFSSNYPDCVELNGQVRITGNDITNLNGLNSITSINGSIEVSSTSLSSLEGLEAIDTISEYFDIVLNNNLISVEGLDNLKFIGQDLDIIQNHQLENFVGFNSLTTVGDFLRFWYNSKLKSISGFSNLSSIDGNLWIETHSSLTDLSGFAHLDSVGEQLYFRGNTALQDLSGLESLSFVGTSVYIINNDSLLSLNGINNIEPSSIINLGISNNLLLSTCEVESVCGYLSSPNGNVSINDNAPGCNSLAEVEAACGVSVSEFSDIQVESIYPNPASNFININKIDLNNQIYIIFYNQLGQIAKNIELTSNRVDISHLEKGLYIVEIKSNSWVTRQKFIKK
jgi:hypothetical protein